MSENQGVGSSFTLPDGDIAAGTTWTVLAAEPLTPTATIGVGLVGTQSGAVPQWQGFFEIWTAGRPSPTVYLNQSSDFVAGAFVTVNFSWVHGSWWQAQVDGVPIQTGTTNGTVDLGTPTAAGFSATAPAFPAPSTEIAGNSTDLPGTLLFYVALKVTQDLGATFPSDGVWTSAVPGWNVSGQDQSYTQRIDQVAVGAGVPSSPPSGSWLWGIGGPGFQTLANVTTPSAGPLEGFGVKVNLTAWGSLHGPNASSYVLTLTMPIAWNISIGVGLWVNSPGSSLLPFYEENISGNLTYVPGDDTYLPHDNVLELWTNASFYYGLWSFYAGSVFTNGTYIWGIAGNGTLDLGTNYTSASAAPDLIVQEAGITPTNATALLLNTTFLENVSGNWTAPSQGFVGGGLPGCGACSGSRVEGYLQDPFLAEGAVLVEDDLPALPSGTLLWNGPVGPSAQVSLSGIPAQATSLEEVSARVEVNGSGEPLLSPRVIVSAPTGVLVGAPWYPATGGAWVNLTFPSTSSPQELGISASGAAAGWSPGTASAELWLLPGSMSVIGRLAGPALVSSETGTLVLWVNGTGGVGPLPEASLTLKSALGATLGPATFAASLDGFELSYTAPQVSLQATDEVTVLAQVPGFIELGATIPVPLVPRALSLIVRPLSSPVVSGSRASFEAWVNASAGGPLSGAVLQATFGLVELPPSLPSVALGPGLYGFSLKVPLVDQNLSEAVVVQASVPGYGSYAVELLVPVVVAPLFVSAQVLPLTGGAYGIELTVTNSSGPLSGASTTLSSTVGVVLPPVLTTGATGNVEFTWTPASGASGTFTLTYTASAPGFYARSGTVVVSVPPASSGALGLTKSYWFLLAPLLILVVFLLLWAVGRWRAGPPRPPLLPMPAKAPPEEVERKEGTPEGPTFLPKGSLGKEPPPLTRERSATTREPAIEAKTRRGKPSRAKAPAAAQAAKEKEGQKEPEPSRTDAGSGAGSQGTEAAQEPEKAQPD